MVQIIKLVKNLEVKSINLTSIEVGLSNKIIIIIKIQSIFES